jgi:peptidoglycan-N-acetylglucosamine deacetylase
MRLRRPVLVLAAGLAAAIAILGSVWGLSRARCLTLIGPAICRVETSAPVVALTFDDGPTAHGLEAILPVLDAHGVKATFFLIGGEIERRPDLALKLRQQGHELGDHSYSHVRMVGRTPGFYDAELARTEQLLARAGARSGLFRPPYGKKLVGLPLAVRAHGLKMVMWSVEDPVTSDPAEYARQIVAEARPGSIILVHAMYRQNTTARAALPALLDGLERKGLRVVTVGELLAKSSSPPAKREGRG